jgi:hypothetical protein
LEHETEKHLVSFQKTDGSQLRVDSYSLYLGLSTGDLATVYYSIGTHSGEIEDFGVEASKK